MKFCFAIEKKKKHIIIKYRPLQRSKVASAARVTIPAHRRRWDGDYMPKIIGITTGIYEGNNYAKIFSVEPFPDGRGIGERAIIDRADYNYVMMNVLPKAAILIGSEVILGYDRNGKVNNVQLVNPVE